MKLCLRCAAKFEHDAWRCEACGFEPPLKDGFAAFAPELAAANQGYDAAYYGELYALEAGNYWFRARNALLVWATRKYFHAARSFLEIGCGTGFVLAGIARAMPQLAMHASEVSSSGLPYAAHRAPRAALFQMDARAIPFADHFDVVGLFDVIEHIEEDTVVLAQVFRAMRAGGGLIVTVPQHRFLWSAYDEHAHHVRRYSAGELRDKVMGAGFRPVMMTSFVSLLLPLMMLSRRLQRKAAAGYDVLADLRVGRVTNWLLESVLAFERGLIRLGVRFPAGGSLLMVARKI
ncbi:MAG: class I SAM-dependent methyltransferase [Burkholderiales bacterium]